MEIGLLGASHIYLLTLEKMATLKKISRERVSMYKQHPKKTKKTKPILFIKLTKVKTKMVGSSLGK